MADRPLVENASNKDQIAAASVVEKNRERQQDDDLRALLGTPAGRNFIWRLFRHCKLNQTIWTPSAQIHYNAGQQDVGHFILAEVVRVNPGAYLQMMQDAKAAAERSQQQVKKPEPPDETDQTQKEI